MIATRKCSGAIEIRDGELDGNVDKLHIGGKSGDKGWQVPATGLLLQFNQGTETVANVLAHHHALDGAMIVGDPRRSSARSSFSRLVSRYNGRQDLSLTSGRGYDFSDCEFSHTGRGPVQGAPGAGVDIEAEGKRTIRDVSFTRCKFIDNRGAGMVADGGDSARSSPQRLSLHRHDKLVRMAKKPQFSFTTCTFVGATVHAFGRRGSREGDEIHRLPLHRCPKLSPNGKVFIPRGPIANLAKSDNVLFDHCRFDLAAGTLPWSSNAIYRDCTMRQRSAKAAMPRGKFLGTNQIDGPVNLSGSMIEGNVTLNGKALPRGTMGRINGD